MPKRKNSWDWSSSLKHQWLPSEFSVAKDGCVSIDSYVNNLHPNLHASLYPVLADIFAKFIPLFERVLSDLETRPPRRVKVQVAPL